MSSSPLTLVIRPRGMCLCTTAQLSLCHPHLQFFAKLTPHQAARSRASPSPSPSILMLRRQRSSGRLRVSRSFRFTDCESLRAAMDRLFPMLLALPFMRLA
jgi:hypothetical protein